jgi:hypothetical protein
MSETNGSEHELVQSLQTIALGLKSKTGADQYKARLIEMVATSQGRQEVRAALEFLSGENRIAINNVIPDGSTVSEPLLDIGEDEESVTLDGTASV